MLLGGSDEEDRDSRSCREMEAQQVSARLYLAFSSWSSIH